MNRITLTAITAASACAVAVPAVLGLSGNPSFSQRIPVPVPSQAQLVQFDTHSLRTVENGSHTAKPGDDHGHDRTSSEPEPGDDHGGDRTSSEPEPEPEPSSPTQSGDDGSGDRHGGGGRSGSGGDDGGSGHHGS